jgi:hypothetical protein
MGNYPPGLKALGATLTTCLFNDLSADPSSAGNSSIRPRAGRVAGGFQTRLHFPYIKS